MAEKPSFQETFFPVANPAGNQVIFGDEQTSSVKEEIFGKQDGEPDPIVAAEEPSAQNDPEKPKKESRRSRPSSVNEKQILNEAKHWKSSYLQESEKARALEQENQAIRIQFEEMEQARRQSELKAIAEREDNLRMQMKIARAAGENDYADEVSSALNQALIQKELQVYDRYKSSTQPVQYQQPQYQQTQQIQRSPVEDMRQQAFDEFCQRNPWYGKNQSLTNLANTAMSEFVNVLELGNQEDAIYSPQFFDVLENEIKHSYGIGVQEEPNNQQYDQPRRTQPSTRFADVPRGNTTMAEQYASQNRGGRTFTPEEVRRTGTSGLQMKVGNQWVSANKMQPEVEKNRHRIVPINKGFRIEYQ